MVHVRKNDSRWSPSILLWVKGHLTQTLVVMPLGWGICLQEFTLDLQWDLWVGFSKAPSLFRSTNQKSCSYTTFESLTLNPWLRKLCCWTWLHRNLCLFLRAVPPVSLIPRGATGQDYAFREQLGGATHGRREQHRSRLKIYSYRGRRQQQKRRWCASNGQKYTVLWQQKRRWQQQPTSSRCSCSTCPLVELEPVQGRCRVWGRGGLYSSILAPLLRQHPGLVPHWPTYCYATVNSCTNII